MSTTLLSIIFSVVRTVAPYFLGLIAGKYPAFGPIITDILGFLGTSGLATWGALGHTEAATVLAAAKQGFVKKIEINPTGSEALRDLVADMSNPVVSKVVTPKNG
jgi:hypothetical protein